MKTLIEILLASFAAQGIEIKDNKFNYCGHQVTIVNNGINVKDQFGVFIDVEVYVNGNVIWRGFKLNDYTSVILSRIEYL
jgi:hypothetical protein